MVCIIKTTLKNAARNTLQVLRRDVGGRVDRSFEAADVVQM